MFKKPLQPLVQIHAFPVPVPNEPTSSLPRIFSMLTPQNHFKVMVHSQQRSRASSASSVEAPDEPLWVTLLGGLIGMLAFW